MDADYRSIGVLALAMDTDYFFGDLALLPWAASVAVDLGRDAALVVKGDAPAWEESWPLEYTVRQQDFTVRGWAAVDYCHCARTWRLDSRPALLLSTTMDMSAGSSEKQNAACRNRGLSGAGGAGLSGAKPDGRRLPVHRGGVPEPAVRLVEAGEQGGVLAV